MKNAETLNAVLNLIARDDKARALRLAEKRESILTGLGVVKTAEKATKAGINYGSASIRKAALWASVEPKDADLLASAWGFVVALDALKVTLDVAPLKPEAKPENK
jgi:hypothetical protein